MFSVKFVYSQDLFISPTASININSYFNRTTSGLLNIYEQGDYTIFPFLSVYMDQYWDKTSTSKYENMFSTFNSMAGSYFRINEYLSIPLCFTLSMPIVDNNEEDYFKSDFNYLLNSGLILETRFGTLGGFIGWAFGDKYNNFRNPDTGRLESEKDDYSTFAFSIVPILKTSEFQLLGNFIKSIDGFFGIDINDGSTSWSLNITSQPIIFENWSILSIAPYILRTPFNLEAVNEIYGLKTGFNILNKFSFLIDGGYKIYTDIDGNVFSYEDTPFLRLTVPFWYEENGDWFGATVYIDKALYTTKIGLIGKLFKLPYAVELSFYPYLIMSVTCTVLFADVWSLLKK